jgi:hypothetical protein
MARSLRDTALHAVFARVRDHNDVFAARRLADMAYAVACALQTWSVADLQAALDAVQCRDPEAAYRLCFHGLLACANRPGCSTRAGTWAAVGVLSLPPDCMARLVADGAPLDAHLSAVLLEACVTLCQPEHLDATLALRRAHCQCALDMSLTRAVRHVRDARRPDAECVLYMVARLLRRGACVHGWSLSDGACCRHDDARSSALPRDYVMTVYYDIRLVCNSVWWRRVGEQLFAQYTPDYMYTDDGRRLLRALGHENALHMQTEIARRAARRAAARQ